VVYSDRSGRRIRRPVRRRPQQDPANDDDPKVQYIRRVAAEFPRYTPEEVYAEIYHGRNRHDIPKALVLQVLGQQRTRSMWPFRR
jgi:hypothetical protein